MPPIIHCIRHGQGLHNVAGNYSISDPLLTPLGRQQCEALRCTSFAETGRISLVVASPLCRALETAFLIFEPALTLGGKCNPKILAMPDAQEISDDPCDTGSSPALLADTSAAHDWPVDLSLVHDGWNVKAPGSRYGLSSSALFARARHARVLLRDKIRELVKSGDADAEIVLIAHGSFLHYLTGDWEDALRNPATGWHNCETRSYTFEDGWLSDADKKAKLVETETSRRKRGLAYPMYGQQQQKDLYELAMRGWEAQGLPRPDKLT
ncbi:hypothetical protein LLEC1_02694 [Akanthomyces lecanii]|uniref:Uncharacterized protein n=1 Tax=Cordyceps confragosa TaxID=2714763 RepID=A0A179IAN1_CORDF|nr:hypothetical protein LLEC1_02694 [Akanthomyces lecanii]